MGELDPWTVLRAVHQDHANFLQVKIDADSPSDLPSRSKGQVLHGMKINRVCRIRIIIEDEHPVVCFIRYMVSCLGRINLVLLSPEQEVKWNTRISCDGSIMSASFIFSLLVTAIRVNRRNDGTEKGAALLYNNFMKDFLSNSPSARIPDLKAEVRYFRFMYRFFPEYLIFREGMPYSFFACL